MCLTHTYIFSFLSQCAKEMRDATFPIKNELRHAIKELYDLLNEILAMVDIKINRVLSAFFDTTNNVDYSEMVK